MNCPLPENGGGKSQTVLFENVSISGSKYYSSFYGQISSPLFYLGRIMFKKNPGDLHTVVKVLILIGLFEGVFI